MYINQIFELSMVLDNKRFHQVFKHIYNKKGYMKKKEDEYIDKSLEEKGITVVYRDSQYKKKIKLFVNIGRLLNGCEFDANKVARKLNKRIGEYFDFKYKLDDFILSGMRLVVDINVGSRENVQAYLKVFRRIGRVKGFSPASYECFGGVDSFCLDGNSNGIEFMIYDLQGMCMKQATNNDMGKKRLKTVIKASAGVLRIEVYLAKPKVIRSYIEANNISDQNMKFLEERRNLFLEIFVRIIPFGNYYKKDKAVEIIWNEVEDIRMKRKMLRLLELIPEKKSLYLAQKAMNYRNVEKVVETFAKINLSPITISKRQDVKQLKNIYEYLMQNGD